MIHIMDNVKYYSKRHFMPIMFFLFTILLSSCAPYTVLSAEKMHDAIQHGDHLIVDIRIPEKYTDGHIPGAVNIVYHPKTFINEMKKLPTNKDLYLYCGKGLKTEKAIEEISHLGFKKIYVLSKGFQSWKEAGLQIEK